MSDITNQSEVTKEVEAIKEEVAKLESELSASAGTPVENSAAPEVEKADTLASEPEIVAAETAAVPVRTRPAETTFHPEVHGTRQPLDFRIANSVIRNPS